MPGRSSDAVHELGAALEVLAAHGEAEEPLDEALGLTAPRSMRCRAIASWIRSNDEIR